MSIGSLAPESGFTGQQQQSTNSDTLGESNEIMSVKTAHKWQRTADGWDDTTGEMAEMKM